MTDSTPERTYRRFDELDVWDKSRQLWQFVWQTAAAVPLEEAQLLNRLKLAALNIPLLLAKAHQLKYWDRARRHQHLKNTLELLAELEVLLQIVVDLEHLEEFDQAKVLISDLTKMTAGMLKKKTGVKSHPSAEAVEAESY